MTRQQAYEEIDQLRKVIEYKVSSLCAGKARYTPEEYKERFDALDRRLTAVALALDALRERRAA